MPLTIGQLTTEVVAETDGETAADAGPGGGSMPESRQAIRADLAALARQAMRTRAEGFDD
jgi:hypothetical protein